MIYEDFKGKHEGEEIIIVGNGPGLANISVEFLNTLPSFGINYGPWYSDILADGSPSPIAGWTPDYWHGLDPHCFQVIDMLPENTFGFVNEKDDHTEEYQERLDQHNFIPYLCYDQVEGVGNANGHGPSYSSSAFSAMHIGHHMGAKRFLFVGFDCSWVNNGTERVGDWDDQPGVNLMPHFYNGCLVPDNNVVRHDGYNEQAGFVRKYMEVFNKEIINMSEPTMCDTLIRGDFRWN